MPNDEVIALLTNFRDTQLAPNLATHQTNLATANATAAAAAATATAEAQTILEYSDSIDVINAEISKLTPPPG